MNQSKSGAWEQEALCAQVDSELFFPEKGKSGYQAKRICAQCPVTAQCLEFALSYPFTVAGVWGGTTESQRRRMYRERRR